MLRVSQYDKSESHHAANFPNYILMAFSPVTFIQEGWPHRINCEKQLWRLIDSMQENRFEANLLALETISEEEFSLLKELTIKVLEFSEKLNCKLSAKNAITRSLLAFRVIQKVLPRSSTVLEVGPGSGYLSAILALSGYKVLSLEISQGFYLYQNHLFRYLLKDKFLELITSENLVPSFEQADLIHVPWWCWADTDFELPQIDLVSCNHTINEMHPLSAKFLRRRSQKLLRSEEGLFVFESSGLGKYPNLSLFDQHFIKLYHGTCNGQPIQGKLIDEVHIYGKRHRQFDFKKSQNHHPMSLVKDFYEQIQQLNIKTKDEKFSHYIQANL